MKHSFSYTCLVAILVTICTPFAIAQKISDKGSHVRIMKNGDGSSTQFKRDHTNQRLEQTSFSERPNGEKVIRTRTMYVRDIDGRLRSGIIEDGQKIKLYRIIYGYDRGSGRLIAENMYDMRVIRRNDPRSPQKETPVRALRYSYNAQGQRSKPVVYVGVQGRTAEELKKWIKEQGYENGTLPIDDPFRNQTVNPNAKPLRR